jgi:Spy/CpxP family protein refolding chaperone
MKTGHLLLVVAAVLVLTAANNVMADEVSVSLPKENLVPRLAAPLQLTADQKLPIKATLESDKSKLQPLAPELRATRKDLRMAIHADKSSEAVVRSAAAIVADVEADLAVERMKLYAEIAPILTDGQKQQLAGIE